MYRWHVLIFLFLPLVIKAQTITTFAGSGIYDPQQLAFDRYGNLYTPTGLGNQVLKIDTAGIVTVFAGTGITGYGGDSGLATNAEFNQPDGIAIDTFENVYITDAGNQRIRKIDISTGIISTIAGTGTPGFVGDGGPATLAQFTSPGGLYFDKFGDLYIADEANWRIRMINTSGIISTIAGNGTEGTTMGDGGPAIAAACSPICNMCMDAFGNLYFINQSSHYTIRKISATGIISTIAGDTTGSSVYNGDGIPALGANLAANGITFNASGELVISDYANNRIREIDNTGIIHTIAGNGMTASSGNGGPSDSAAIYYPCGIAFDYCYNLYIAQIGDPCIRKVAFNPACWPTGVPQVVGNEVDIYPNPATEVINIDGITTQATYSLINVTGIIEQSGTLKQGNNSIAIQSLSPGMYLLECIDNEGKKTVSKIVKQ